MNCATSSTTTAPVVAHNGHATTLSRIRRAATVGARLSPPRLHSNLLDLHEKHRSPCQCTATGESQWFSGPRRLPLRHDRDVEDLRNWNVLRRRDELNLRHLNCARIPRRCMYTDVHNRRNCTCDTSMHLVIATTGMSPPCPRTGRTHVDDLHNRDIDHPDVEQQHKRKHENAASPAPPPPPAERSQAPRYCTENRSLRSHASPAPRYCTATAKRK